jgi:hypothetical protein
MPRLPHTVEQIIAKLRETEVALSKWPTRWHQRQSRPVKDGWCSWYWKHAPGDAVLEELEKAA